MLAMSLVLALGGCSWTKKMAKKLKGSDKTKTEQTMKSDSKKSDEKSANKSAESGNKGKRVRCSTKKTYDEGTACWHWKKGARIGKPGYGDKEKAE